MDQRISLLSLGVSDIERARAFYEDGLGWQSGGPSGPGILFFQLPGFIFSLIPHDHLAGDAQQTGSPGEGYRGMALACNVHSRDEVHAMLTQAEAAGGTIIKQAVVADWGGYSGYFTDPDGHAWEVAHAPGWDITEDGRTLMT